jgi:hypothetical protein
MSLVTGWTGETACALQAALRLSNEAFAEHLGIGVRTGAAWHQKPTPRPKSEMQQLLDTAFEKAPATVKERFAALLGDSAPEPPHSDSKAVDGEQRLSADPNISAALDWLDKHAGWQAGTARREVASRLVQVDVQQLQDRASHRRRVDQRRIAEALGEYYSDRPDGHGRYAARHDGGDAMTSILTRPEWLDLDCSLIGDHDRLTVTSATDVDPTLDEQAAGHAVQRLAARSATRSAATRNSATSSDGSAPANSALRRVLATDSTPATFASNSPFSLTMRARRARCRHAGPRYPGPPPLLGSSRGKPFSDKFRGHGRMCHETSHEALELVPRPCRGKAPVHQLYAMIWDVWDNPQRSRPVLKGT